ncbi:MAG: 50S ribosomal protein L13 [Candidatus Yanofskybacteria bacterium RIFCSPHIGHO2_02_FULL_41_29]|uniref:50S ribosomal protein L13 n=1 Tax=Candidatus Yanofskybacteria bacterium RIFCSPHIGHO2_01_FULL_41_53 TaxID=1802663 RepID=A0A1F8EI06_9BACT|nr:MAG: 50S ribosomal protein L13 [Candidatus Yanofskybacteria bacterium RIFCSPHIGHO2_01_FULL_41_53]OGN11761.1 MAG: 50S ribosomal protein L13 [Candidatus Yanofskybacteria bacterium RIFCSPHIGHO2_02_FULL_41_29]OGN18864.1 MAG: 50S ribosomal protein L13 [Candidatus Yanofskybacteria bacterium RIFCSPHIGHO2_12_FULL_41_9]OGN22915.1 MAG: 50S ribosomal protein L13 [Candidatus Yanofskybacteria bacterium RIFCSPLOWO2_01_FULL_41_67]OGN30192.1 MAG: 50S ribosomal protein L13 [Candidatus Yanofskybacteria bacter
MKYTLDATNQSLGRLASKVAILLRGKNLASYMPNELPDNEVIVKNLKSAKFTGSKFDQKKYYHYSGYHSGIKARKLSELWESKPDHVLRQMVYRMLPVNRTRDKIIKNLKFN